MHKAARITLQKSAGWGMADVLQAEACLPSKWEALSSNPSTTKKKKKKRAEWKKYKPEDFENVTIYLNAQNPYFMNNLINIGHI
jgi:hypothetical protein